MKRDSIWAFVAGILLTAVFATLAIWALFPSDFGVYVLPMYVFETILWVDAYRTSRKKAVSPSI